MAFDPIVHDTYMDDCISGTDSAKQTSRVIDEIQVALRKGGFTLKGFTISGSDPPEHINNDQKSVTVGLKWFSKGDFLKFNISDLNFNRKVRGRKVSDKISDIWTKRVCISRVPIVPSSSYFRGNEIEHQHIAQKMSELG